MNNYECTFFKPILSSGLILIQEFDLWKDNKREEVITKKYLITLFTWIYLSMIISIHNGTFIAFGFKIGTLGISLIFEDGKEEDFKKEVSK